MHPLDEFRAIMTLREQGLDEEEIAARFHMSVATVKQRLRLASVSPRLLELYANDEMKLGQVMAFSITNDHVRQEQVWDTISRSHNQDAYYTRSDNLHRPVALALDRLKEILCKREQRYVGAQLTFSFERQRIMLEESDVTRGLVGRYVETYAFADGRLEVRWKGHSLSYRVFDKDQRVTHAAITENKRLGDVLAYIKERQDKQTKPDVKTNSEKIGYKPRGRKPGRRTDFMNDPAVIARRRQALSDLDAAE